MLPEIRKEFRLERKNFPPRYRAAKIFWNYFRSARLIIKIEKLFMRKNSCMKTVFMGLIIEWRLRRRY